MCACGEGMGGGRTEIVVVGVDQFQGNVMRARLLIAVGGVRAVRARCLFQEVDVSGGPRGANVRS